MDMDRTQFAVAAWNIPTSMAEETANMSMTLVVSGMSMVTIMISTATKSAIITDVTARNIDSIGASPHVMSALRRWRPIFESCRPKSRQSKSTSRI